MNDKCRKVNHAFRTIAEDEHATRERCEDCGVERTFSKKGRGSKDDYNKGHTRDIIQPFQENEFDIAYGSGKGVEQKKKEFYINKK